MVRKSGFKPAWRQGRTNHPGIGDTDLSSRGRGLAGRAARAGQTAGRPNYWQGHRSPGRSQQQSDTVERSPRGKRQSLLVLARSFRLIDRARVCNLAIRYEWFQAVTQGQLRGSVVFAQDDLGNFYAYLPKDGSIWFFRRSEPTYAAVCSSFFAFMDELERRDFRLEQWMDSLPCTPYRWDA